MKNQLIKLFILVFILYPTLGTSQTLMDKRSKHVHDVFAKMSKEVLDSKSEHIEGTPYLTKAFHKGQILFKGKPTKNDELAQLSAEIDTILGSEDVKKQEQSLKYKKDFDRENAQRAKELRFIVVKQGDTLSSIAQRAYGRASAYMKIYRANPDLVKNPNRIYIGMKLRVPMDEEYKTAQSGN